MSLLQSQVHSRMQCRTCTPWALSGQDLELAPPLPLTFVYPMATRPLHPTREVDSVGCRKQCCPDSYIEWICCESILLSLSGPTVMRKVGEMHTSNPISLADSLGFINRGKP